MKVKLTELIQRAVGQRPKRLLFLDDSFYTPVLKFKKLKAIMSAHNSVSIQISAARRCAEGHLPSARGLYKMRTISKKTSIIASNFKFPSSSLSLSAPPICVDTEVWILIKQVIFYSTNFAQK